MTEEERIKQDIEDLLNQIHDIEKQIEEIEASGKINIIDSIKLNKLKNEEQCLNCALDELNEELKQYEPREKTYNKQFYL